MVTHAPLLAMRALGVLIAVLVPFACAADGAPPTDAHAPGLTHRIMLSINFPIHSSVWKFLAILLFYLLRTRAGRGSRSAARRGAVTLPSRRGRATLTSCFPPIGRQVGGPPNEPLSLTHSARPLLCISAPLCAASGSETNRWGSGPGRIVPPRSARPHCGRPANDQ